AHEGVLSPPENGLDAIRNRKIARGSIADDEDAPHRAYRNAVAVITTCAAQVRGIDQGGAGAGHFGDEGITSAGLVRLVRILGGEVGGSRLPHHVYFTVGVYLYPLALVVNATTQVSREYRR